jgi:hypothetical protein
VCDWGEDTRSTSATPWATEHLVDELVDRAELANDRVDFIRTDPGKAAISGVQVVRDLGNAAIDFDRFC